MMNILSKLIIVLISFTLFSCNSDDVKDAVDIADGVPRKDLVKSRLAINAFVNDSRFGSISNQFEEVRRKLGLNRVRILFNWDDNVQPGPNASLNMSFYDAIINSLPSDMEALVIVTHIPSWMRDKNNWLNGNPRNTFVERWVKPVVNRYGSNPKIVGFQIWNEPNMLANNDNVVLSLSGEPENYVEMLASANNVVKEEAPGKLVVSAATTAINQNFPESLDYNKAMENAGAKEFCDVWAVHYYGKQYENLLRRGGVEDFLNDLGKRIWITESGEQGSDKQLAYGEEVWSFLFDKISNLERLYIYQFTENTPADVSYGLKNGSNTVSDLYVWLESN
jgi:hypothetical protein